jgi:cellulose synthase-like protein
MPFGSGECQLSVSSGLHFHGYWPSFQSSAPSTVPRTSRCSRKSSRHQHQTIQQANLLPGMDIFVSIADPEKEPVLVTANTILSILAADYPVEKLACYLSDGGGALLIFEAMAEAASFANLWVSFCRKHDIEPRNPDSYFNLKRDPFKNKVKPDFVKDRRWIKREYDEFKVRINGLPYAIRRRSDAYHAREEIQAMNLQREKMKAGGDEPFEPVKIPKATWMADSTHWPGTWLHASQDHARGDHAGIIQVPHTSITIMCTLMTRIH